MNNEATGTVAPEGAKTSTLKRETAIRNTVASGSKKTSKGARRKKQASTKTTSSTKGGANITSNSRSQRRTDTKKAIVLELLGRKAGATIAEIAKATDWQNHSIRGFISGHVTKKMGLTVESSKNEAGQRTYRIA